MDGDDCMCNAAESLQWYAFRVRSRHEKQVSFSLREKGYRECLPLTRSRHRWADRFAIVELPLFPGYIFCETTRTEIGRIRCTAGIIDVIRAGSTPLAAERSEIESLRKAVQRDLQMENWPYVKPEPRSRMTVMAGPLSGFEGMLVEVKGTEKLVLSIDLLQRSVLVELPASSVVLSTNVISTNATAFNARQLDARA